MTINAYGYDTSRRAKCLRFLRSLRTPVKSLVCVVSYRCDKIQEKWAKAEWLDHPDRKPACDAYCRKCGYLCDGCGRIL